MESTEVFIPEIYLNSERPSIKVKNGDVLGRSKGTIIINDPKLSSTHCQFVFRGLRYFVQDLGSTNGVFINGDKVNHSTEAEFKIGDRLKLGSVTFTVGEVPDQVKRKASLETPPANISLKSALTFFGVSRSSQVLTWVGMACGLLLAYISEYEDAENFFAYMIFNGLQIYGVTLLFWYMQRQYFRKSQIFTTLSLLGSLSLSIVLLLFSLAYFQGSGNAVIRPKHVASTNFNSSYNEALTLIRTYSGFINAHNLSSLAELKKYSILTEDDVNRAVVAKRNEFRGLSDKDLPDDLIKAGLKSVDQLLDPETAARYLYFKPQQSQYPSVAKMKWIKRYSNSKKWVAVTSQSTGSAYLLIFSYDQRWKFASLIESKRNPLSNKNDTRTMGKRIEIHDKDNLPSVRELAFLTEELKKMDLTPEGAKGTLLKNYKPLKNLTILSPFSVESGISILHYWPSFIKTLTHFAQS